MILMTRIAIKMAVGLVVMAKSVITIMKMNCVLPSSNFKSEDRPQLFRRFDEMVWKHVYSSTKNSAENWKNWKRWRITLSTIVDFVSLESTQEKEDSNDCKGCRKYPNLSSVKHLQGSKATSSESLLRINRPISRA